MKKIFFLSFIFLLACTSNAFAHTTLESSTPQDGEVIQEELKQIILTFGTKIEQGSEFTLQNSNGESIPVENISISENQLLGDITTPLDNGDYQVKWNIIGADGHVMEGDISFTYDLPVAETTEEQNTVEQSTEETEPQTTIDENETSTVNEGNQAEVEDDASTSSNAVPIIIGVLIVIVIASFLFMMKRKK